MSTTRTNAQLEAEALEALRLHNTGLTERQIAERMTANGKVENASYTISQPTVHRRIQLALELYVIPGLDEARKAELSRLDTYLERLSLKIDAGDVNAIKVAVDIQKRRATMLGLDKAPEVAPENKPQPAFLSKLAKAKDSIVEIEAFANYGL